MRRCFSLVTAVLFCSVMPTHAQQKWGSLTGKVTLDGDIPAAVNLIPQMMKNGNANDCLAAPANQKVGQVWTVDPKTKGVANVFVFLKANKGQAFPIQPVDKVRKQPAVIDQPFCAFLPHVIAHYPSYFDGEKQVPTGEKFIVKNSAKIAHNVKGTASSKSPHKSFNFIVTAGQELEVELKPQPNPFPLE